MWSVHVAIKHPKSKRDPPTGVIYTGTLIAGTADPCLFLVAGIVAGNSDIVYLIFFVCTWKVDSFPWWSTTISPNHFKSSCPVVFVQRQRRARPDVFIDFSIILMDKASVSNLCIRICNNSTLSLFLNIMQNECTQMGYIYSINRLVR